MIKCSPFVLLLCAAAAPASPQAAVKYDTSLFRGLVWRQVGPFRGGRVTAVAGVVGQPLVFYMGATGGGVWKTVDAGLTWEPVSDKYFTAGSVGAIAVAPSDPNVVYVGTGESPIRGNVSPGDGMYKSMDAGRTWSKIGLADAGQIAHIAVHPQNPDLVYVAALGHAFAPNPMRRVFRSDDGGTTWSRTSDDHELRQRAWYFTHVFADPGSADGVYVLNTSLLKSVDGGKTFTTIRAPHGDHHALWIDQRDPARMINGNDGGATISMNGGATWTGQDNQPTAQFYHVIATTHFPYRLCGAQQDNSTVCIATRTDGIGITGKDWYDVGGGESGWIAARQDDPDVVFAGSYGGLITRYDHRTEQTRAVNAWPDNPMGWGAANLKYRFQWTFPIVLSPLDPNDLFIGAQVLFKSANEGQSWRIVSGDLTRNDKSKQGPSGGPITKDNTSVEYYNTIFTVAPSPKDSNVIWAGTDDGLVQVTRDGGKTWQNVTPKDLPEWALVSTVEASPHDAATAYAAATRYKLDDFRPYVYKTSDYGRSWKKLVAGIPASHFVRVVREDPTRRGLLFAGGEFGIYVSFDDGANWQSLQLNLPVVPIHHLTGKDHDLAD